jgi:hypothetical protein
MVGDTNRGHMERRMVRARVDWRPQIGNVARGGRTRAGDVHGSAAVNDRAAVERFLAQRRAARQVGVES